MQISKLQIAGFVEIEYEMFIDRMSDSMCQNFHSEREKVDLKIEIRKYIEEAMKFDFKAEETIEQYLYLKWKYPIFKNEIVDKDILEILTYPDRDSEMKIDELIFFLSNNSPKT